MSNANDPELTKQLLDLLIGLQSMQLAEKSHLPRAPSVSPVNSFPGSPSPTPPRAPSPGSSQLSTAREQGTRSLPTSSQLPSYPQPKASIRQSKRTGDTDFLHSARVFEKLHLDPNPPLSSEPPSIPQITVTSPPPKRGRDDAKSDAKRDLHEALDDAERSRSILNELMGGGREVFIYNVTKNRAALEALQKLERKTKKPLKYCDIVEAGIKLDLISKPGLHLGWEPVHHKIIFVVRISPWNTIAPEERRQRKDGLQRLMGYSRIQYAVKKNGSQKGPQIEVEKHARKDPRREQEAKPHANPDTMDASGSRVAATNDDDGDDEETIFDEVTKKRIKITDQIFGRMVALGWHQAMGAPKPLVTYSPDPGRVNQEEYDEHLENLKIISKMFELTFCSLYPNAYAQVKATATQHKTPSFASLTFSDDFITEFFANSLTATYDDFCNFTHTDNDYIPIAFGMWWAATHDRFKSFQISDNVDHKDIKDGHFIFAEYGYAVDFQAASGLVEIIWRGSADYHVTIQSESPEGITRWGTSIQLTNSGVRAAHRALSRAQKEGVDISKFIIDAAERRENLGRAQKGKRPKASR